MSWIRNFLLWAIIVTNNNNAAASVSFGTFVNASTCSAAQKTSTLEAVQRLADSGRS